MQKFYEPLSAINFYQSPKKLCERCNQEWQACKIMNDGSQKIRYCKRCLKTLKEHEEVCSDCNFLAQQYPLMHQLYCDYHYLGKVKATIQQYKITGDVALREVIANQIQLPKDRYDFIVPVPSPIERDEIRTFNPVIEVLKAKKIDYHPLLASKMTKKQSTLNKSLRAKRKNPFYLTEEGERANLAHASILLVDDIYTTGLTTHQAAQILFFRKIEKIDVFTFVR